MDLIENLSQTKNYRRKYYSQSLIGNHKKADDGLDKIVDGTQFRFFWFLLPVYQLWISYNNS
jgi:hypothetical protein